MYVSVCVGTCIYTHSASVRRRAGHPGAAWHHPRHASLRRTRYRDRRTIGEKAFPRQGRLVKKRWDDLESGDIVSQEDRGIAIRVRRRRCSSDLLRCAAAVRVRAIASSIYAPRPGFNVPERRSVHTSTPPRFHTFRALPANRAKRAASPQRRAGHAIALRFGLQFALRLASLTNDEADSPRSPSSLFLVARGVLS